MRTPTFEIATWVKVVCALTMAAGTAAGGWRIIQTLGHKMVRLHPIHGFAAETTAATVLMVAAKFGMPVSTTHAITTSIMGVGTAKSTKALRWELVERIIWTWVLTLPATGLLGYVLVKMFRAFGWAG
jgi:PiT family inorganic phosphate transporter